jgi:putative ABC transport system permease protein
VEGWLANASLSGAIPRLSISVAALAVSLSLTIAIAIMVSSFRDTVVYWVEQTFKADLFVGPETRRTSNRRATLSPEIERAVATHPAVRAVDRFHGTDVRYDGTQVGVLGTDLDVLLANADVLFKAPPGADRAARDAVDGEAVLVSEAFALKHRKAPGDVIDIPTASGAGRFRIAAVYYDYSSDRGILLMNRPTYTRHFGEHRPAGLSVYLREAADPDAVRAQLLDSIREADYRVFVRTNASLREEVLRIFDNTFAITYALELVAISVAILGVIGTLTTLMIERRRELAMLQLIGADRGQVRRMIMTEAALIGSVSQAVGIVVGLGLSGILIYVINVQSFGWTIQFHLPVAFIAQSTALVILTTALAGLYPGWKAAAMRPAEQVVEE